MQYWSIDYYILDGKNVKQVSDIIEWAKWIETAHRTVARTELPDGSYISTVFLAVPLIHLDGQKYFFETMIFGGEYDQYKRRYATWDEAEAGHQSAIEMMFDV